MILPIPASIVLMGLLYALNSGVRSNIPVTTLRRIAATLSSVQQGLSHPAIPAGTPHFLSGLTIFAFEDVIEEGEGRKQDDRTDQ